MQTWQILGGYHPERLAIADALAPVRDIEATMHGLMVIRDALDASGGGEGGA